MILKASDIIILYKKIIEISQREDLKIPVKLSFKFLRNAKILESFALSFEEASHKAIMQYAAPTEDEGKIEISKENLDKVQKQVKELENEDVEISLIPIKLSELEGFDFSMQDLAGLYPIIENEEV